MALTGPPTLPFLINALINLIQKQIGSTILMVMRLNITFGIQKINDLIHLHNRVWGG